MYEIKFKYKQKFLVIIFEIIFLSNFGLTDSVQHDPNMANQICHKYDF